MSDNAKDKTVSLDIDNAMGNNNTVNCCFSTRNKDTPKKQRFFRKNKPTVGIVEIQNESIPNIESTPTDGA